MPASLILPLPSIQDRDSPSALGQGFLCQAGPTPWSFSLMYDKTITKNLPICKEYDSWFGPLLSDLYLLNVH